MQKFSFKYANTTGEGYYFFGFIGIPLLLLGCSVFLLDYISWIFWISVPMMIFCVLYTIGQIMKRKDLSDVIIVDDEGFTSEKYGRIFYRDIESIPPYGFLDMPPPSMRIRLYGGKMIAWDIDGNSSESKKDADTLRSFREAVLYGLTEQLQKGNEISVQQTNSVIRQLKAHRKWDFGYITIPLSTFLLLVLLVRSCA